MQYSTVQYKTRQYNAVQYGNHVSENVLYPTMPYHKLFYPLLCSALLCEARPILGHTMQDYADAVQDFAACGLGAAVPLPAHAARRPATEASVRGSFGMSKAQGFRL